jgi:hypothetical protein
MQELVEKFRKHVIDLSNNTKEFVHHEWFVKYHLNLIEEIALELCDMHREADRNIVRTLVWIHDYAKILDKEKEHDAVMFQKGKEKLLEFGFENGFADKVIEYLAIFERKMEVDLHEAPIEVRIASSADGAAHLIGPFWSIYFKENSDKSIEELMESNRKKLKKDWERKIVLPEVKKAFEARYKMVNEQAGDFPKKYFS